MNEIFNGEDGKISGRRVIGTIFLMAGIALLFIEQYQDGGLDRFAPSIICLSVGLLFWGLVTVQNIIGIFNRRIENERRNEN